MSAPCTVPRRTSLEHGCPADKPCSRTGIQLTTLLTMPCLLRRKSLARVPSALVAMDSRRSVARSRLSLHLPLQTWQVRPVDFGALLLTCPYIYPSHITLLALAVSSNFPGLPSQVCLALRSCSAWAPSICASASVVRAAKSLLCWNGWDAVADTWRGPWCREGRRRGSHRWPVVLQRWLCHASGLCSARRSRRVHLPLPPCLQCRPAVLYLPGCVHWLLFGVTDTFNPHCQTIAHQTIEDTDMMFRILMLDADLTPGCRQHGAAPCTE